MNVNTGKEHYDYDAVKCDVFNGGYMSSLLKKLNSQSNDFYSNFLTNFEDLLTYVEQLEEQVKTLNLRLATNTPEDVQLLLTEFDKRVTQTQASYISQAINLKNENEKLQKDFKILQANLSTINDANTIKDNIKNEKIKQIEDAIFFHSLPNKIIEDFSFSDKYGMRKTVFKFLDHEIKWIEMSEEKFKTILKYYIVDAIKLEPFVYSYSKNNEFNALLFNHI